MSKPVRRIIFTGDFLRPSAGGMRPTQHENIAWLSKLLDVPLALATSLPRETVHWENDWMSGAALDLEAVQAIYGSFWLPPKISSWPTIFAAKTLPESFELQLASLFAESFVVGFELPPYLTAFFDRQGIGFVDCSLSPLRFMDDLMFDVSSNSVSITESLAANAVPEALIRLQAGVVSATVAKGMPHKPAPNSLLVMLQTSYDKVVIHEGRFNTMLDHFEALEAVAADYSNVLIKAHPSETRQDVMDALLKRLAHAKLTTENFYRLVSHHNVKGVAALSSSAVREAQFFGKRGHYLIPGMSHDRFTPGISGHPVGEDILQPDFWRSILASAPLEVTAKDGLRLPSKPNRFRLQLREAWGYNQIDSDISAKWASGE